MWAACTCRARERSACVVNTNRERLLRVRAGSSASPAAACVCAASPGEEARAWSWAPTTGLLAVTTHNCILSSSPGLSPSPPSISPSSSSSPSPPRPLYLPFVSSCLLSPLPSLLSSVVIHLFLFSPPPLLISYPLPLLPFLPSSPFSPSLSSSSSCKNSCIFSSFADVSSKIWHKTEGWNRNKKKRWQKGSRTRRVGQKSAVRADRVFLKRKDYSYILNQRAHPTQQITHIVSCSRNWCTNDSFFLLVFFFSFCFGARVGWSNKSMNFGAVIILLGLIKGAVLGSAVSFSRTDTEEWAGMKNRRDENRADLSFHTGGGMSLIRWRFWSAGPLTPDPFLDPYGGRVVAGVSRWRGRASEGLRTF